MSGWTEREEGNVKLIHYSTSSLIEMIITTHEEVSEGVWKEVKTSTWLNYKVFSELKNLIKGIDFP